MISITVAVIATAYSPASTRGRKKFLFGDGSTVGVEAAAIRRAPSLISINAECAAAYEGLLTGNAAVKAF